MVGISTANDLYSCYNTLLWFDVSLDLKIFVIFE